MPIKLPELTLILGEAGSGKTDLLINACVQSEGHSLLITATDGQAKRCREIIKDKTGETDESTTRRVVDMRHIVMECCGSSVHPMSASLQFFILNQIISEKIRPDAFLADAVKAPGFVKALTEAIREWKLHLIEPEMLRNLGRLQDSVTVGSGAKIQNLADLYEAYTQFLHNHDLVDTEDLIKIAAERIRDQTAALPHSPTLIAIDGYFRLTPAHVKLMEAIATAGKQKLLLSLCLDSSRPLLFTVPEETRQLLQRHFQCIEKHQSSRNAVATSIQLMRHSLYGTELPPNELCLPDGDTTILNAPNRYAEVELVARTLCNLHEKDGYDWSECGVMMRSVTQYAELIPPIFERFNIPVQHEIMLPLPRNPVVKTLQAILNTITMGWQGEHLMTVLRSEYLGLDRSDVEKFRMNATAHNILDGRSRWLWFAQKEYGDTDILKSLLLIQETEDTIMRLKDPKELTVAIHQLKHNFNILTSIEMQSDYEKEHDHKMLKMAIQASDNLLEMFMYANRFVVEPLNYLVMLLKSWENTPYIEDSTNSNSVSILEPYRSRDRYFKVAILMGLVEKKFPLYEGEDPFLLDDERNQLLSLYPQLTLSTSRTHQEEERLLFYLAATAPSEKLLVSFPRTDMDRDCIPSFYLTDMRNAYRLKGYEHSIIEKRVSLAEVAPLLQDGVNEHDSLIAGCIALYNPAGSDNEKIIEKELATKYLKSQFPTPESRQKHKHLTASRQLPPYPQLNEYIVLKSLNTRVRPFSVTELEIFALCPFKHFAMYTLGMKIDQPPSLERIQSNILHSALCRFHSGPCSTTTLIGMQNALDIELGKAEILLSSSFKLTSVQLKQYMEGAAYKETLFQPLFNAVPKHNELAFGMPADTRNMGDEDRDADTEASFDPASKTEVLKLVNEAEGTSIELCGVIDRVDLLPDGNTALVMDYKLRFAPDLRSFKEKILSGKNLQLPVYMLALSTLWHYDPAIACYDVMNQRGRPRLFRSERGKTNLNPVLDVDAPAQVIPISSEVWKDIQYTAANTLIELGVRARGGEITPKPGKHCRSCHFGDLCRVSQRNEHDGGKEII